MATGALFPGARQRDRFGKALKALAHAVLGSTANGTVGTHSIRKGNVVERYMHYEKAGDQFVGRVVAGLPLNSAGFAQLPPHFDATDSATVTSAVRYMFPRLSKNVALLGVLKLGLASLVFHADYLRSTLPASHAVLHTAIFRDDELRVKLRSLLRSSSATLAPTGLPPYVELYRQLEAQHETLKALSTEVVAGVRGIWDEKELSAGTVTQAYIDRHFSTILERLGGGGNSADVVPAQPPPRRREHMLFAWGGRLHKLPEDFCFPSVDVATAWALWWLGKDNEIPYRTIDPSDLSTKLQKRILSEWRTEEAVVESFDCAVHALDGVVDKTLSQRQRRFGQLMVVTVARIMRETNGAKTKRAYSKRKRS
ncbi:hypothetical protein H257_02166 [Aphanomyces astaci]|uniref:Uncharacterized protein n=1 Tax=Aphanomyces astaci TaxID=112090 RepID=W4H6J0_APHAT|nr:hypothetical protein H257_02166 [Aphanomyces astaci]ETV87191.1 hypothetical protein H257_02166 [Aphanomyces astaci]|eukprot:XP_009823990.1 hypothetical protein H257_02166 [Aphanomyces astaci]